MKTPAVELMRKLGLEPDPWQIEVLESTHPRLLLNCCRQAGKSTVVALLALAEALWQPGTKVLIVSRTLRQSTELFNIITHFYRRLGSPSRNRLTRGELQLATTSRIVCLPCKEETIRGYSNIHMLIIDEAARVPDDICRAVSPMLAVSAGRLFCLSTPCGKRGFFYQAWLKGGTDWQRIEVPATKIPRISPEFLAQEKRLMGDVFYRQEYGCSFEVLEGLVYPDLPGCVVPANSLSAQACSAFKRRLGGIDFGWRNPFAALWGGVDSDGIHWLTNEHYCREQPLSYHATQIPREVYWYVDPHGATERAELRVAGFTVKEGLAAISPGIASVQARIKNGTLRILEGACPNLLSEAGLYRYDNGPQERWTETPIPEYNHALDALRYLISRLDKRSFGRATSTETKEPEPPGTKKPDEWCRYDNEALWTPICNIPRNL